MVAAGMIGMAARAFVAAEGLAVMLPGLLDRDHADTVRAGALHHLDVDACPFDLPNLGFATVMSRIERAA